MPSPSSHPRDPLHGVTLATIVSELVGRHGWAEMGSRIPIRCFLHDPSVKSSLTFLRKTPWARQKVEAWYIAETAVPFARAMTPRSAEEVPAGRVRGDSSQAKRELRNNTKV